ncbi:MAG: hypothetical protein ACUVTL_01700, partial [Thermoproteota archaeon]
IENYMKGLIKEHTRAVVGLSTEPRKCVPECSFFVCKQRALIRRGSESYCRWVDDLCNVKSCAYASCMRHVLLPDGLCGRSIKRKTKEALEIPLDEDDVESKLGKKLDIR